MKHIPSILLLVLVVAACNLSQKMKSSNSTNSSSSSSSTVDGEPVEKPNPTAAQSAAIANGQSVSWDQQGISWTLPANWKKLSVSNESFSYSGDGAFLIVAISTMGPDFPTDVSIKAMHEAAKTQQKIGKYDESRWLELGGVRGVGFRESKPEGEGDIRRLEWQGYRKYAGQSQLVTMILSSNGGSFPKHQDEMYGIMYSSKINQ